MRFIRTLLLIIVAVALCGLAVVNSEMVVFELPFIGQGVEAPFFIWMFAFIALGVVLAFIVMLGERTSLYAKQRKLNKEADGLRKENQALRVQSKHQMLNHD